MFRVFVVNNCFYYAVFAHFRHFLVFRCKGLFTYDVSQKWRGQTPPLPPLSDKVRDWPTPLPPLSEKIRSRLTRPPPPLVRNQILMYNFFTGNTLLNKRYIYKKKKYLHIWKVRKRLKKEEEEKKEYRFRL